MASAAGPVAAMPRGAAVGRRDLSPGPHRRARHQAAPLRAGGHGVLLGGGGEVGARRTAKEEEEKNTGAEDL